MTSFADDNGVALTKVGPTEGLFPYLNVYWKDSDVPIKQRRFKKALINLGLKDF